MVGEGCLHNSDNREGGLFLLQEYIDFLWVFGCRWGGEKYMRLREEERKGKRPQGIESPYIHNSFFPPRD
jgi:hypothetical protein